ncbi:DUF2442 domain-containing protein [uncultured Slackia sp.]|uniref:DUF2442 domain-containing protein n=1 Tax=uncultured Slackia sp. TaxID=665903 RepID=UPI0025E1A099|nr:DUF2442 domain-containing protein [uncultured Slackia sp.]
MRPMLQNVVALDDLRLLLTYESGEQRVFSMKPYIKGDFFGELSCPAYFKQVSIAHGGDCVVWPHGQDMSPEDLYEMSTPIDSR